MRALVDSLSFWHLKSFESPAAGLAEQPIKNGYQVHCQPGGAEQTSYQPAITKSAMKQDSRTTSGTTVTDSVTSATPPSRTGQTSSSRAKADDIDRVIELAHYPDARRPSPNELAPIERDDFPAPPFPYAGDNSSRASNRSLRSCQRPPQRRCVSGGHEQVQTSETNAMVDHNGVGRVSRRSVSKKEPRRRAATAEPGLRREHPRNSEEDDEDDEEEEEEAMRRQVDYEGDEEERAARQPYLDELRREQEELQKISTGIGQLLLTEAKQREEQVRRHKVDPRNASRTPSAKVELPLKLRFDNPVNACE